jgi:hypothetical protein
MKITGKVVSKTMGQGIPYASVTLVNQYGDYLGIGTSCNAQGEFTLTSDLIYDPNAVVFSSQGYEGVAVDAVLFDEQPVAITLKEKTGDLSEVVITTVKKHGGLICLLLLLFAIKKH